jgi:predicted TIM-barrel fold metal-dependent hydrolase
MVLDIHAEATDTSLPQLATLLSHNTNTRIIWDHAGWSNSGGATAAVISGLMATHPNLYLSLKMRGYNSGTDVNCSPVDSSGNLKTEWNTLLTTYADRIMVGTDAKYWSDSTAISDELSGSYNKLDNMLKQLPSDTVLKIRNSTAKALFGL